MSDCKDCKLPEHDPEYYSWKYVTPLALSEEIRKLDTPAAWQTADHVSFILPNGKISHSKGLLATGSSEFVFAPPIPGLRLDLKAPHITFAADFDDDKMKSLHRCLAEFVCLEILQRADMLEGLSHRQERLCHRLLSGHKFEHDDVTRTLQCDDLQYSQWKVSATKQDDSKKRKLDENK